MDASKIRKKLNKIPTFIVSYQVKQGVGESIYFSKLATNQKLKSKVRILWVMRQPALLEFEP